MATVKADISSSVWQLSRQTLLFQCVKADPSVSVCQSRSFYFSVAIIKADPSILVWQLSKQILLVQCGNCQSRSFCFSVSKQILLFQCVKADPSSSVWQLSKQICFSVSKQILLFQCVRADPSVSVCQSRSFCLSVSKHVSLSLSLCAWLSICMSVSLFVCLPLYPSPSLSVPDPTPPLSLSLSLSLFPSMGTKTGALKNRVSSYTAVLRAVRYLDNSFGSQYSSMENRKLNRVSQLTREKSCGPLGHGGVPVKRYTLPTLTAG